MKSLVAILALVMAIQAQAQVGDAAAQASPQAAAQAQAAPSGASGNQIYILNNQKQASSQGTLQAVEQNAVQEQPASMIMDTPLKVSPADQARKRRQDAEAGTEDGIVQALEKARMDDEMKRREKFNNAIAPQQTQGAAVVGDNNTVQQTQVLQQPIVQPIYQAPVQQVVPTAPAPAPVKEVADEEEKPKKKEKEEEKVDIRSEIRAALNEQKPTEEKQTYYIGALTSFGNYDNVINISRAMGWGVVVGTTTPERVVAEGSFTYANYQIERGFVYPDGTYYPLMTDMRQYNIAAAVKYQFLPGKFRPTAGALLSYTRRSYSLESFDIVTSDAVDVGAVAGADLQIGPAFSVGVDFRYMTNVGYRQNTNRNESFVYAEQRNDPEKLDYYSVNLLGKFTF